MKAMILAAGFGTRLKPWTDKHPKALALVNGKSLLQRNVLYLQQFGIYEVVVNVHHFADQLYQEIQQQEGWGSLIEISDETDAILETGGGLKRAEKFFYNEPCFVLMNADVLTDLPLDKMLANHLAAKPLATLATTKRETKRALLFDDTNQLCGWENKVTGEKKMARNKEPLQEKAFSGVHIISNEIFRQIRFNGKFSIIDVYLDLAKSCPIQAFDHSNGKFKDVGTPASLLEAEKIFP